MPSALVLVFTLATGLGIAARAQNPSQTNVRNTFPGRRIGGGTRGECAARLLVHLVPADSTFAPASSSRLALLMGPTTQPRPAEILFRPFNPGESTPPRAGLVSKRTLPAATASVAMIPAPDTEEPVVWESSYDCSGSEASTADDLGLDFVQPASPPAISLLVKDPSAQDRSLARHLQWLGAFCGRSVATEDLSERFMLQGVITGDWPARLPVNCEAG